MKKLKFYAMTVFALVGGMMCVSCTSEDLAEVIEQPKENVVTFKTSLTLGDVTSRFLTADGKKTFIEGEKIAVVYSGKSGHRSESESDSLCAKDIKNNGKDAEFTVKLTNPLSGGDLMIIYPSKMVKEKKYILFGEFPVNYSRLISQDGTLKTIAQELDYSMYVGKYSEPNEHPVLFTLENQLAILKLIIRDADKKDITGSIKRLTILNDDNRYVINNSSQNVIYVAMRPVNKEQTIKFKATDGVKQYVKEVSGKELQAGKIYPIYLTVNEAEPDIQAVDLGLSVKWANMNLGANVETDKGLMFAWGETIGYSSSDSSDHIFDWDCYKLGKGDTSLTKYNSKSHNGIVDNKNSLESEDDAATMEYGGSWRMPTKSEFDELFTSNKIRSREYVENYNETGVNGLLITALNGKSIFLPYAGNRGKKCESTGQGFYWTSTLSGDVTKPYVGLCDVSSNILHDGLPRYRGMSIRAVKP